MWRALLFARLVYDTWDGSSLSSWYHETPVHSFFRFGGPHSRKDRVKAKGRGVRVT